MAKINMVHIDFDKFYGEVKKTNVPIKVILKGIGYASDNYFTNAKARGKISSRSADDLERIYGIKRKLYEISEPMVKEVKVEVVDPPKADVFDWTQLYNTIYAATLAALKKNADDMKDRLFEGK